jgi:integrase
VKQPQPFYRKQTQSWYVQLGKRQVSLGKDEAKAWKKYHKLMAGRRELNPDAPVAAVVDEFLEWVQQEGRSPRTYDYYRRHLESFVRHVGARLTVEDLRPLHVTRWVGAEYSGCGETTRNSVISVVQRAMNWAVKQGIVARSPIQGIEKPPRRRRETFVTADQFKQVLAAVKDKLFSDFVTTLWETGCRPKEAREVEARHFDADRGVWLFERVESKGKRNRRLVVLTDDVKAISARLAKQHKSGPIFRNTDGKPWTKDSLNCRFRRLQKKLGFPVHAYAFRHGFATVALGRGVDSFSVAKLMGHSDTRMVETVYQHLDGNDAFLRNALKRANGGCA